MKGFKRRDQRLVQGAAALLGALAIFTNGNALAQSGFYNNGKVLLTGGVSMVDGAGGGGITPWAAITGYETRDGINGDLHYTYVNLPELSVNSFGAAVGFYDRVELSYANDVLTTGSTYNTVGLALQTVNGLTGAATTGIEPWNTTIRMNVVGAKVRLIGEAIYDSDNLIPQVAVGGFYKWNDNKDLLKTLGADKANDYELYMAVTKIFFPISTLINVTGRYTSANQTGLVGFGAQGDDKKQFRVEGSIAYLLAKNTAIGGEFQQHGHRMDGQSVTVDGSNLSGLLGSLTGSELVQKESNWKDVFVAYAPNKNLSFVLAYAMLGNIVLEPHQNGFYISAQASF
jgi:DUF3034 family protein